MDEHDFLDKELKATIIKMRILVTINKKRTYSYALVKEFGKGPFLDMAGPALKNTVYNTIKALEKSGYIEVTTEVSDGRLKKFYTVTSRGRKVLKSAKKLFVKNLKAATKLF